jgi:twitching motility protein PilT
MSLVSSLLQAIVRVDGEALVMHVGEKPYVVSESGNIDLATRGLTFEAVNGLVTQLLSADARRSLEDVGAAQYELPRFEEFPGERFIVTAARGGDDVWAEIRRRVAGDEDLAPAALFPSLSPASSPAASMSSTEDDDLTLPQEGQLWPGEQPRVEAVRQPDFSDDDLRIDVPDLTLAVPVVAAPTFAAPTAPSIAAVNSPLVEQPVAESVEWSAIDLTPAIEVSAPELVAAPAAECAEPVSAAAPGLSLSAEVEQELEIPSGSATEPNESQKAIASWLAAFSPAAMLQRPEPARVSEPAASVVAPSPGVVAPSAAVVVPSPTAIVPPPAVVAPPPAVTVVEPPQAIEPPPAVVTEPVMPLAPVASAPAAPAAVPPPAPVADVAPVAAFVPRPPAVSATPVDVDRTAPPASSPVLVKPSFVAHRESEAAMSTTSDFAPFPSLGEQPQPAVVLPIARGGRDTMTPEPSAAPLERLLRLAASRGATALFISTGSKPSVRLDGDVQRLDGTAVLSAQEIESLLLGVSAERAHDTPQNGSTEWVWDLADLGSVRCSTFRDHRGPGAVFRIVAVRPQSAAQLGLSREIQALVGEAEGLVLVSGPRASGKSTMISSMVDLINRTRRDYVITIESEVNVVHDRHGPFISQREVRGGSDEVGAAARAALREHPDVLVIDDLRTSALMSVALDAAASGQLVIGSVPAHHTSGALERLIDLYHPEHRRQAQLSLAQNLRGVVSQVLLRKSGGGRVAAREILLNTPLVSSLLAESKMAHLPVAIEGGRKSGMVPLNDALVGFVQSGAVDVREAYRRSVDRAGLLDLLKRQGIDTSFVERLA